MKKNKTSRFNIGEQVVLTKNYHRFLNGQVVTIVDNTKKLPLYTNKVKDTRPVEDDVPTKYLKKIKWN